MSKKIRLLSYIETASMILAPMQSLRSFVSYNPLEGFTDLPFEQALKEARVFYPIQGVPTCLMGRKALLNGLIDNQIFEALLHEHLPGMTTEHVLNNSSCACCLMQDNQSYSEVNRFIIKYITLFLDEGQAAWHVPERHKGFFYCFGNMMQNDTVLRQKNVFMQLGESSLDVLYDILSGYPEENWLRVLRYQLTQLPGWAAFVKWRAQQHNYQPQQEYPITLVDYLAARLVLARIFNTSLCKEFANRLTCPVGMLWLQSWEETYRKRLIQSLSTSSKVFQNKNSRAVDAQFVFCIDVRSEPFRRHLERSGNYETFGFAGFFGVPMLYNSFISKEYVSLSPALIEPVIRVKQNSCSYTQQAAEQYQSRYALLSGLYKIIKSVPLYVGAAFTFVEFVGVWLGFVMFLRTLSATFVAQVVEWVRIVSMPKVCFAPQKDYTNDGHGLTLKEQVFYAYTALSMMGLREFAPIVFLCGHASQTLNNPYASALDCGACGGNPGGVSAQLLACILNDEQVRVQLKKRDVIIPENTVFVAAQHNTTTDQLNILNEKFLSWPIAKCIKQDIEKTSKAVRNERNKNFPTISSPQMRAVDWAQVRPEWGLANNASMIIGLRDFTYGIDLQGRVFLHSYDWALDNDGRLLETIMTGPMIVAQWINAQYYFSTVDPEVFSSGSKVTHNAVGKLGVMQGNASDLMLGLPMQSIMKDYDQTYHEPLRLLVIIQAPKLLVEKNIEKNAMLKQLCDNKWISLMVFDPSTQKLINYVAGGLWNTEKIFNK